MDYNFFLFCKLLDCLILSDLEYDLQCQAIAKHYESFCLQDINRNIGTYESIETYLKAHIHEIAKDLQGTVIVT